MYQSFLAASQRAPSALTASFSAKGVTRLILIRGIIHVDHRTKERGVDKPFRKTLHCRWGHSTEKKTKRCQALRFVTLPAIKSRILSELVGSVCATAPPVEKTRLVAQLMRPLGILSLVTIANGVFASIRFRGASIDFPVGVDDVQNVQTSDVIALTSYVQQVSMQAVDGLAQILATSPAMASSAAALLLVQILIRQSRKSRVNDVTQ